MRQYYAAYDDRYRQVHAQGLQWFAETPSPIVSDVMQEFGITKHHRCLELGCGEGRDATPLLLSGCDLLATDISPEAIAFCRTRMPEFASRFDVLDCVGGTLDAQFDFIYAIAVLHMLVKDNDRSAFYRFIHAHLAAGGIALIGTMGDGNFQMQSNPDTAFDLQPRTHEQTGKLLHIAATSCRIVSFDTFTRELTAHDLTVIKQGITAVEPDFPQMMFAVVRRN